jgi:phospholipase/carboxylesterase
MTQTLLETVELQTGEAPNASVIWMHGLGADGNDFVPIVAELDLGPAASVRFVFPHAPMQPVTINNGYVMRAWYDVTHGDLEGNSRRPDEQGLRASQAAVELLVRREVERGTPASRIVLAGFSQGGAMALQTGLRYPERLAGIMVLSSYLPLADRAAQEASPANAATPVFMAHGTQDPVIACTLGAESHRLLQAMGHPVEWHEYPMPHSVCLDELRDIAAWLRRVLPA